MSHHYTGVGSRETPTEILKVMRDLAKYLAKRGMVLRSGAADGADTAFEEGCNTVDPSRKQIFLPWEGFNGRKSREQGVFRIEDIYMQEKASEIAKHVHPAWDKVSRGARALHTRNVYQVLGPDLQSPSRFLICWAKVDKDREPKGGTRTAVMLARQSDVRTYNLALEEDFRRIQSVVA